MRRTDESVPRWLPKVSNRSRTIMLNQQFVQESLERFSGCDNNIEQAGNADAPSIWLFGIEFGTYKSKHDENIETREVTEDDTYSVKTQLKWQYNRKAFKLLASIDKDYGVKRHIEFAERYKPFVTGSTGYFKGNLYPYPCNKVKHWPVSAIKETGATTKNEYLDWCKKYRLPVIYNWIEEHQPKIFIGVGITNRNEFSEAVFGSRVDLTEYNIVVNGHKKRLFCHVKGKKKLTVIPHFSGRYGLNSDGSLQKAGEFISDILLNRCNE